jgi:2-dehydropantoate 2-reductase
MRQVPVFLVIGDGRVARHFKHYFSLLNLSSQAWCRKESLQELSEKITQSTHVLLLIKDDAIDAFIQAHLSVHKELILIHFSGSLISDYAYGCHPLMTFGMNLYERQHYQSIPFILDHDTPDLSILLPGLPNPQARLHKSLKSKYHALCVMSGNFSCLLWQHFFKCLENEFNLPSSIVFPYLQQQTQNLLLESQSALTGPLARNDFLTIEKNLAALEGDPFKQVYESFVSSYQTMKSSL